MAFPWKALRVVELASGHLVEDLRLGLDLAAGGMAPYLCRQTYVESRFPTSEIAGVAQRQRWEVGSLSTLIANVPAFFFRALVQRNLPLLVLALDALVPPLVVFSAALIVFLLVATLAALAEITVAPLLITAAALVLFAMTIAIAWADRGRTVLPATDAGYLVAHLLQKLRIYRFKRGERSRWIRTDRQ